MDDIADIVLVLTTHPVDGAQDLARVLVERKLAACVQVIPAIHAWYRWEGEVEAAEEAKLEIKTTRSKLPDLERLVRELHPYDVPELLVVSVGDGHPAYLEWIRASLV